MDLYLFDFKIRPKSNTISIDSVRTDVVDPANYTVSRGKFTPVRRVNGSQTRGGELSGNRFVLTNSE